MREYKDIIDESNSHISIRHINDEFLNELRQSLGQTVHVVSTVDTYINMDPGAQGDYEDHSWHTIDVWGNLKSAESNFVELDVLTGNRISEMGTKTPYMYHTQRFDFRWHEFHYQRYAKEIYLKTLEISGENLIQGLEREKDIKSA